MVGTPAQTATGVLAPGKPPANAVNQTAVPTVQQIAPAELKPGQSYALALTGSGFLAGMQIDLGSGIVVPKTLTVTDSAHASVTVQVLAGAAAGRRVVTTTLTRPGMPAGAIKTQGPGFIDVLATSTAGPMILDRIAPMQVQQGQAIALTLHGSGFSAGMAVSFGPGIAAAGPVTVTSPEIASVSIQVAPQAPPIVRHPTLLASGRDTTVEPGATLTVVAAAGAKPTPVPIALGSVPVILTVSPSRVFTGQKYTLTLRGQNLVPQLQLDLGSGIAASGGLRVQSPSLATLDVTVADTAPAGMRWVGMQFGVALAPIREDASLLVQRSPPLRITGVAPRPPACTEPRHQRQGTIVIDGPVYTGEVGDYGGTFNVPVLNDQTNFVWHEANAGLAERYEIRFYSGSTLVLSRPITARPGYSLPHNLRPDDALIDALTTKVADTAKKYVNVQTQPGPQPTPTWDLAWQVVGFKTFYDSCTSPAAVVGPMHAMLIDRQALGQGHEVEIEHSEPVPIKQASTGDPLLDLPAAPTGLACGAPPLPKYRMRGGGGPPPQPALGTTQLGITNEDRGSSSGNRVNTADYVGDRWVLSGTIDLTNSPWSMQAQPTVTTPTGGSNASESETVNNVFVDWGDGSVEPLTVGWKGALCGGQTCFKSNTETANAAIFNLGIATNSSAFVHAYRAVDSYTMRVYMLPANAVQQHGVLPMSVKAGAGGLYGHLLSKIAVAGPAEPNTPDLGYMLFCQQVQIQPRTDPATNGPLELVDIKITGFPNPPETAKPLTGIGGPRVRATGVPAPPPAPQPAAHSVPRLEPRPGSGGGNAAAIPQFSSCDVSLVGGATLEYIGTGTARLTWFQDGAVLGTHDQAIPPSQSRTQAQLAPPKPADPVRTPYPGLESPAIDLSAAQIGTHALQVRAEVVADSYPVGRALKALGAAASRLSAAPAAATAAGPGSAPPLGLLGPRGAATAGLPPIVWVNQAPPSAPGVSLNLGFREHPVLGNDPMKSHPPNEVVSDAAQYQTTAADPSLPCTFNFPVTGGKYVVAGLQHGGKATVTSQSGSYSGTGTLNAWFTDGSGTGAHLEPLPIHLKGWTMQSDGVTVANGSFDDQPPPMPLPLPGVAATLQRIAGTAGQNVTATLSATLSNQNIHAPDGSTPQWKGIAATLSPQGDWYADQQPVAALLVYDSGFTLTAQTATLDFSQSQGTGGDAQMCGGGNASWIGVTLNQARLTAFNFDLQSPPAQPVTGWALDGYGLCGSASFPAASFPMERGTIKWGSVTARATHGAFTATYNNLTVHAPWLNVDLSAPQATTQLTAGRGAGVGGINFNLTSPAKVTLTEGNVTLTANHLAFSSLPSAGGWAVKSDTTLSFSSPQGVYAGTVNLNGFDYGMNGAGSFADGTTSRHLSLAGQKGTIGGALVDLKSVDVTVGASNTPLRLSFGFDSTLTISKTLPSADVAVSYEIDEPASNSYTASGPVTAPFRLDKPFPDANPTVHLHMTPTYTGASQHSGSGIIFASSLDLGMFDGPPVSGQFVLGYVGSSDYWIGKAVLDLDPTGVPLVPGIINLYQIGGGLGYNVSADSFKNSDLTKATPVNDGQLVFDATLMVGSVDHTTFGLLGDFSIKPGGQDPGGRMDYHAWLLDPVWSGQSPIYGYFSYSGGVFDGTLNAHLSLLDDQIALNAINDAIHMHVGGGQWYFHLGTQANPVNGHVFFANGQAWADLGSDGFMLGLIARVDLTAGDCGGACAYIHDSWQLGASITPSPLAFSANASENFNLGACAAGFCVGANASAGVTLGLPPPQLSFNFSLGGCPPGQISVGLEVLPSLNPNVNGSVCL